MPGSINFALAFLRFLRIVLAMAQTKGGRVLAAELERAGHRHEDLETHLGMSRGYVSKLINGANGPGRAAAAAIEKRYPKVKQGLWDIEAEGEKAS